MNTETGIDDFFGDEDEDAPKTAIITMGQKTTEKISRKMRQEGYIVGKSETEQKLVQERFDNGFEQGLSLGAICGKIYTHFRILEQQGLPVESADVLNQINVQTLLFETLPESYGSIDRFEASMIELRQVCERLCPMYLEDLDRAKALLLC